jgi:hypothetical protein
MSEKIVQTAGRNAPGAFAPEFAHFSKRFQTVISI